MFFERHGVESSPERTVFGRYDRAADWKPALTPIKFISRDEFKCVFFFVADKYMFCCLFHEIRGLLKGGFPLSAAIKETKRSIDF